MRIVEDAVAVENVGLEHDMHALRDSSRQILLAEAETLDELDLVPGEIKENITSLGVSLGTLKRSDRLLIGNDVILEITQPCSPCSRMEEIRPGLLKDLAGRRGMLARVLRSGTIRSNDPIMIIPKE